MMAFDEKLADRIYKALGTYPHLSERKMFGGLCFMVHGHMCFGIVKDSLMVRVGPERYQEMLEQPHVRPMDFTGRPMTGMIYVTPDGIRTPSALQHWLRQGLDFAESLPPKAAKSLMKNAT